MCFNMFFINTAKFQYFKVTLWMICVWRSMLENLSFKPSTRLLLLKAESAGGVFEIEAQEIPNVHYWQNVLFDCRRCF